MIGLESTGQAQWGNQTGASNLEISLGKNKLNSLTNRRQTPYEEKASIHVTAYRDGVKRM